MTDIHYTFETNEQMFQWFWNPKTNIHFKLNNFLLKSQIAIFPFDSLEYFLQLKKKKLKKNIYLTK